MQTLMDAPAIADTIDRLAGQILADPVLAGVAPDQIALVGIRSRGELIAERLAARIQARTGQTLLTGALDITLYRDDLSARKAIIIPQGTVMNFRLDDKTLVLIDDVLDTGRSVRAALDAIVDFGRPRVIRLAVLVDRDRHEYPIAADHVGLKLDGGDPHKRVLVRLSPTDAEDAVYLADDADSKETVDTP